MSPGCGISSPAPVPAAVDVHHVPHHAGVVGDHDEGPDVLRPDPQLLLPAPLQLQVVRGQLLDQEVGGACNGQSRPDPTQLGLSPSASSRGQEEPHLGRTLLGGAPPPETASSPWPWTARLVRALLAVDWGEKISLEDKTRLSTLHTHPSAYPVLI